VKSHDGTYILVILAALGLTAITDKKAPRACAHEVAPVKTSSR
jgi:hypothetical protein